MAILVLSSRNFGLLLREACNPNELKIKRLIERSLAKKNESNTLRINLNAEDFGNINAAIWEHDLAKREVSREELVKQLDEYAMQVIDGEPPYLAYSISEWKAFTEVAADLESTLDLTAPDMHLITVQYNLQPLYEFLKPQFIEMIKRGYDTKPKLILPPGV